MATADTVKQASSNQNRASSEAAMVITLNVQGMMCTKSCTPSVERALRAVPGVQDVQVSLQDANAVVTGSAAVATLIAAVNATGKVATLAPDIATSSSPSNAAQIDLEPLRLQLRKFADDRDWHQYHTAENLMQAMVGEVGELCEIFQWKRSDECTDHLAQFKEREREHVGEELADVLSYLVRLCDVEDGVDLAVAVGLAEAAAGVIATEANAGIEQLLFTLVATVGDTARAMMSCETEPRLGLIPVLVDVYRCLQRIASFCGISLADAMQDKIDKNNRKYPASIAYGKREKYTAYEAGHGPTDASVWRGPLLVSCLVLGAASSVWYRFKKR